MTREELFDKAQKWIYQDVSLDDQRTLDKILRWAESGSVNDLEDLQSKFSGPIEFGTAGLRGRMEPGESRMNLATVSRAAYGLGQFCLSKVDNPRIVIGYDARHHSYEFALRSARILTYMKCQVALMPQAWPTPVLAYAVRKPSSVSASPSATCTSAADTSATATSFSPATAAASSSTTNTSFIKVIAADEKSANNGPATATSTATEAINWQEFDAGVMVTASHNPKEDNGYKVYLGGRIVTEEGRGSQIVPPYDKLISEQIKLAPVANEVFGDQQGWEILPADFDEEYNRHVILIAQSAAKTATLSKDLKIVTTAMHGVGGQIQIKQLRSLGFTNLFEVSEQKDPDPEFPTVDFPNPEEPGALDLALALAKKVQADLVIANDPDADRCSIAVFDPHIQNYRQLTGDEIGSLLGQYFAKHFENQQVCLASSVVSSRLLAEIAKQHGVQKATTLTGFKWISRTPKMVFGYEEAIGFNPDPEFVHDKDGPATGSLLAVLAAQAKARGVTLVDELDDLARHHGLFTQSQVSLRFAEIELITQLVEQLRKNPPREFGGSEVSETVDYELAPPTADLKTNGISWTTANNTRVFVRPSGTEPKVKFYVETVIPVDEHADFETLTQARNQAAKLHETIATQIRAYNIS